MPAAASSRITRARVMPARNVPLAAGVTTSVGCDKEQIRGRELGHVAVGIEDDGILNPAVGRLAQRAGDVRIQRRGLGVGGGGQRRRTATLRQMRRESVERRQRRVEQRQRKALFSGTSSPAVPNTSGRM